MKDPSSFELEVSLEVMPVLVRQCVRSGHVFGHATSLQSNCEDVRVRGKWKMCMPWGAAAPALWGI